LGKNALNQGAEGHFFTAENSVENGEKSGKICGLISLFGVFRAEKGLF